MKKYPFSSKAVKAMIAATVAFTPIATTAIVFDANKVEAAYVQNTAHFNSVPSFEKYAQSIEEEANVSTEVRDALEAMDDAEWEAALAPVLVDATDDQKKAVVGLVRLQVNLYTGTYEKGQLQTFIKENKEFFGDESTSKYLTYLQKVEEAVYTEVKANQDEFIQNPTVELFQTLVDAIRSTDHAGIKASIEGAIVLSNATIAETVTNIENELIQGTVTKADWKTAVVSSGLAWMKLYGIEKNPGGGGGGGGTPGEGEGGGTVTPGPGGDVTVTPETVQNGTQVTAIISSELQTRILASIKTQAAEITIKLPKAEPGQTVSLDIPAPLVDAIEAKAPKATIVVVGDGATYYLPVAEIDTVAIAADLGTTVAELTFRVSINPVPSAQAIQITQLLQSRGVNVVASIVDIKLEAVVGDKVYPIKSLGNVYVKRSFGLNKKVKTNNTTGAVLENDGTYRTLPTKFKTVNGQQHAFVSSLTNSIYTVVESDITFPDVNNGKNWAEAYIETLASKYIISGTTAGTYKGDEYMTRAQFAVLLSRALGLPSEQYDNRFKDVKGDEWFNTNGALMSAVKQGIIAGKKDGTFAPNDRITRAESAAMIGRALNLKMIKFDAAKLDKNKKLADFKDAKAIGASTREEVLKVYQAGIMSGTGKGTFNPNEFTKRDQMARILAEFLIKAELMEAITK
ncbi:S-layer homology domain-containing protein [Domibacillus aminovorans]|uniref:S-layer homology domain-containing protein n=1 Tax=Domibacillus aminovorans TaxID=29332 RepID=UPI0012FD8CEC|nr:S-layer homology domain-containing protein [Domibacillus aminovorans]